MYQVKATSGYEIQVVGKGENGLCKVVKPSVSYTAVFTGTYAECVAWLDARACKVIG